MPKIQPSDSSYSEFTSGATDRVAPLSAIDKKMLNFAIRTKEQPVTKTHGQILNHFGMYPPQFWTKVQDLAWHPELHPRTKNRLREAFPMMSTPDKTSAAMFDGTNRRVTW